MSNFITNYNRCMRGCEESVSSFLKTSGTEGTFKMMFNPLDLELKILLNTTKNISVLLVTCFQNVSEETFQNFNKRRFDIFFFQQNKTETIRKDLQKNPYRKKIIVCSYSSFDKLTRNILSLVETKKINYIMCDESHLSNQRVHFLLQNSFKTIKKLYFSNTPTTEQTEHLCFQYNELTHLEYETIDVPDDGNCFFHCLSHFLKKPQAQIRKECIDYFLKQDELIKNYGLKKKEIKQLYENGVWNTNEFDLLPGIASQLYKKTIYLYKEDSEFLETFFQKTSKDTIYLSLKNYHYNIVVYPKISEVEFVSQYCRHLLETETLEEKIFPMIPLRVLSKYKNRLEKKEQEIINGFMKK